MPWPISGPFAKMMIVSSGAMRRKAFGANAARIVRVRHGDAVVADVEREHESAAAPGRRV